MARELTTAYTELDIPDDILAVLNGDAEIPPEMVKAGPGKSAAYHVDRSMSRLELVLSTYPDHLDFGTQVQLTDPAGNLITESNYEAYEGVRYFQDVDLGVARFSIISPMGGDWSISHQATSDHARTLALYDSSIRSNLEVDRNQASPGEAIVISLGMEGDEPLSTPSASLALFREEDGGFSRMDDLVLHPLDGAWTTNWTPDREGRYLLRSSLQGENSQGDPVVRLDDTLVQVQSDPTGQPARVVKMYFYPNPFNPLEETGRLHFETDSGSLLGELAIYDGAGTPVMKTTLSEPYPSGFELEWDGRNGRDEVVGNGVYFAVFRNLDGSQGTAKIAVIK